MAWPRKVFNYATFQLDSCSRTEGLIKRTRFRFYGFTPDGGCRTVKAFLGTSVLVGRPRIVPEQGLLFVESVRNYLSVVTS